MKPPKRRVVYDPIFRLGWAFQLGGTDQSCVDWVKKKYGVTLEGEPNCLAFFWHSQSNPKQCGIYVSTYNVSLISHEIIHAAVHVANVLRMELNDQSEVMPCYMEWVTHEFMELVRKRK